MRNCILFLTTYKTIYSKIRIQGPGCGGPGNPPMNCVRIPKNDTIRVSITKDYALRVRVN